MSKIVKCDIKGFEGQITIPDVLTLPVFLKFRDGVFAGADANKEGKDIFDQMLLSLPGMIQVVEKWELANIPENPTVETWPVTPLEASKELHAWLMNTLNQNYLRTETSTSKEIKEKVEKRNAKAVDAGNKEEVAGDPES